MWSPWWHFSSLVDGKSFTWCSFALSWGIYFLERSLALLSSSALVGGLTSLGIMSVLRRRNASLLWTSLLGAVFHNLGQWVVASLYVQSRALLFYLPVLLFWAVPAGFGVGYLGTLLVRSEALRRKTGSGPISPREGLGIDGLARR